MKQAVIGIDVGTTSTKAVVFGLNGAEIARAGSAPYRNYTPNPGWVEQDPEEIWQALVSTIADVVKKAGTETQILSICMAVQSGSLLPADALGRPLYPLITWLDGRAEEVVQLWKAQGHQQWIKPLSGWSIYPSLCLPTLAWLKTNMPELASRARTFFSLNDFLAFRLTGKKVTNPSNAGGMQLVNIQTAAWSDELCELAGITRENLSEILPSGALIGEILPEVCQQSGLPAGVTLINGGHDQGCTALGLGIIEPGKMLLACGTAWVFTGVLNSAEMSDLPPSLDLNFHALSDRWTLSQSLGGLGASFEWWFQKAYIAGAEQASRAEVFDKLNAEAKKTVHIPDLFFLPMTGGHADPATTRRGGFIGLQLGHKRADLARTVMESAAYELKWALQPVLAANIPVDKLWMVGGAAQSSIWPSILANVTAIPICLPQYDIWPALGAAILAGLGSGVFGSPQQALEKFTKTEKLVQPENELIQGYQDSFIEYQRLNGLFYSPH